jgi:hypothetical protein
VFQEHITKWWNRSKLEIEFKRNDPYFKSKTYEDYKCCEAYYLRVKVRNISFNIARNCKAYLVDVKKVKVKKLEKVEFYDALTFILGFCRKLRRYRPIKRSTIIC